MRIEQLREGYISIERLTSDLKKMNHVTYFRVISEKRGLWRSEAVCGGYTIRIKVQGIGNERQLIVDNMKMNFDELSCYLKELHKTSRILA